MLDLLPIQCGRCFFQVLTRSLWLPVLIMLAILGQVTPLHSQDSVSHLLHEIDAYRQQASDITRGYEPRRQAMEHTIDLIHRLVHEHGDDVRSFAWRADLVELLLVDYLRDVHHHAALFNEFGITDHEQHEGFVFAVIRAYRQIKLAEVDLSRLINELKVNRPLADRLKGSDLLVQMQQDRDIRIPFLHALAAFYAGTLPDDQIDFLSSHCGFDVTHQTSHQDLTECLMQLLNEAESHCRAYELDEPAVSGSMHLQLASTVLIGRIYLHRARLGQGHIAISAVTQFDKIVGSWKKDMHDLVATLGKAHAMALTGEVGAAIRVLDQLVNHPMVGRELLLRLLVSDSIYRLLMLNVEQLPPAQQADAIARAYKPYLVLLNNSQIEHSDSLRVFIYRRWHEHIHVNSQIDQLPPEVRLGIAVYTQRSGRDLLFESEQSDDEEITLQAHQLLERAIYAARSLQDSRIEPAVRSQGLLNLALAMYWQGRHNIDNVLLASGLLVDLADEFAMQDNAEYAIGLAADILRQLHLQVQLGKIVRPVQLDYEYRRAASVLFNKFSLSPAADDHRFYFAHHVLQPASEYNEALTLLRQIPYNHPDYFNARGEMLFCMELLYQQHSGQARNTARKKLVNQATRLRNESMTQWREAGQSKQSISARRCNAICRLVLANAAADERWDDQAVAILEGFELDFQDEGDLVVLAYTRRIRIMLDAGRMQDAADQTLIMIQQMPEEAVPATQKVVSRLDIELDELCERLDAGMLSEKGQEALRGQVRQLAGLLKQLVEPLLEHISKDDRHWSDLKPLVLVLVKSLRLAGEPEESLNRLSVAIERSPDDPDLIIHYAESLFAIGDETSLRQAASYYDRLIVGLQSPYPAMYWNAWLRRLQINNRLGELTEEIPLRIRQLRLDDPQLGGRAYQNGFEALEKQYGGT